VPGVDAALMGPADLSVALGTMDVAHPTVTEYTQRVVEAARRRGLPSGTHVGDLDMLKTWRDRGMRLLMYNYDFGLMMAGGAAAIKELRP
jgi:2-keto-3-deoxy-L-rhamnonate aldolase RhmA